MASIVSNVQQHQQCCRTGLVDVAGATVQQAVCSRRSACQASKHADGKQMSATRQHKHTCFNPAALVAHGASSPSSCPIPPAVSIPGLERHVHGHHERTRPSLDTKPSTPQSHGHGPCPRRARRSGATRRACASRKWSLIKAVVRSSPTPYSTERGHNTRTLDQTCMVCSLTRNLRTMLARLHACPGVAMHGGPANEAARFPLVCPNACVRWQRAAADAHVSSPNYMYMCMYMCMYM